MKYLYQIFIGTVILLLGFIYVLIHDFFDENLTSFFQYYIRPNIYPQIKILNQLLQITNQSFPKNQPIAFGLSSDIDFIIKGIDVLKKLGYPQPLQPEQISNINNEKDLVKSFAYAMKMGRSCQFYVKNEVLFRRLLNIIKKMKNKKQAIGGNGLVMAQRGHREGIKVIILTQISQQFYQTYFDFEDIIAPMNYKLEDIHLVFNYIQGQKWGNITPFISNRFYLNHDLSNLRIIQQAHRTILQYHPKIVVLGGFQILNHRPQQIINQRFNKLQTMLKDITNKTHCRIHIQMADFTDQLVYKNLLSAFIYADSIGMNIQQMKKLSKKFILSKQQPDQFQQLKQLYYNLLNWTNINRIHVHSYKYNAIIYNKTKWYSPENALYKSIINAYEFLTQNQTLQYNIGEFPFYSNELIKCVQIQSDTQVCYIRNIMVKRPVKLNGLGDTISSTSIIYHIMRQ